MKPRKKPPRVHKESFGFLVQIIARRINANLKEMLGKKDIDINIFTYLMMLEGEDGVSQRQLGERLGYPDYFTSRNIDTLVKSGFAERRPNPESRRSFLIFLTEDGKKKAAELPAIIERCNNSFLAPLQEQERVAMISMLQKL